MAEQAKKDSKKLPVPQREPLSAEQIAKIQARLPKELQDRFQKHKKTVDLFAQKVLEKFAEYVIGVALLPPQVPPQPGQLPPGAPQPPAPNPNEIPVLVLIDDTDSMKMSKEELLHKLSTVIQQIGQDLDKNLAPDVIILSELWQSCFDCKDELTVAILQSAPVYDKGLLAAVKVGELHKQMVLKKFERYIVAYTLSGGVVRADIGADDTLDIFIVIDDTDVKKMTRVELRDKLRAIIVGMGMETTQIIGTGHKLNIQVFILTDFWDSLKEANPITFTLLRDAIPFFDRGIFMPWKQLLRMGKIKPSGEAIDLFMSSGEQALKRVRYKLHDIGQEDVYYALLTPSQAALMLYGIPPPTPAETPSLMREIFVKKEKTLDDKYVKILEKVLQLRKDLIFGKVKNFSGTDADAIVADAETYLKEIGKLFERLQTDKSQESVLHTYDTIMAVTRDALKTVGIEEVDEDALAGVFDTEMIQTNKIDQSQLRALELVLKAKKDFDADKLTKEDIDAVNKQSRGLIKALVEYTQRTRAKNVERAKLKVKHGDKMGEVIMLEKFAFIIDDVASDSPTIHKADVSEDGTLTNEKGSSFEELEKELANVAMPPKVFLREPLFEDLKRVFGKDVEIVF